MGAVKYSVNNGKIMTKLSKKVKTLINARCLIVLFAALSLTIQSANAQPEDYIIVCKSHLHKQNLLERQLFTASCIFNIIPAVAVRLEVNQVSQLLNDPDVEYIEPDYKIYAVGNVETDVNALSDIYALSSQTIPYGITMVNAPVVWPKTKGGGVRVALMDTGISMYHPDKGNVVASTSFVTGEAVEDFDGHGTHTSGTIAAADNGIGVVGVAPQADLLIAKVIDNTGSGQDSWLISGIEWAVSNNAKVISMSLGSNTYSAALDTACSNAFTAGTLLVAAAGNNNSNAPFYPAALSSVISVAAIDQNKNKASFSNFGPTIALSAPGVNVYSTVPAAIDPCAIADAVWSSTNHQANLVTGTAPGTVSGQICNCGLATGNTPQDSCPDSVAGNIAHIRRGNNTFAQKVAYARSKGAIGAIISNNVGGNFNGTLNDGTPLVVVSISKADGDNLQALVESGITMGTVSVNGTLYTYYSGTSMACPHVAGVAALIFSVDPNNFTPSQVRNILFNSAEDLGQPGRDDIYGYGLVDANSAFNLIVPQSCYAVQILGYGLSADINHNCVVNSADLQLFDTQWLSIGCSSLNNWCSGSDINHNGYVDFSDLSAFAFEWLSCNDPQHISCF